MKIHIIKINKFEWNDTTIWKTSYELSKLLVKSLSDKLLLSLQISGWGKLAVADSFNLFPMLAHKFLIPPYFSLCLLPVWLSSRFLGSISRFNLFILIRSVLFLRILACNGACIHRDTHKVVVYTPCTLEANALTISSTCCVCCRTHIKPSRFARWMHQWPIEVDSQPMEET